MAEEQLPFLYCVITGGCLSSLSPECILSKFYQPHPKAWRVDRGFLWGFLLRVLEFSSNPPPTPAVLDQQKNETGAPRLKRVHDLDYWGRLAKVRGGFLVMCPPMVGRL